MQPTRVPVGNQCTLAHIILETMDSCPDAGYADSIKRNTCHGRWQFYVSAVSVGLVFSRRIKLLFGKGLRYLTPSGVPSLHGNVSRRPPVGLPQQAHRSGQGVPLLMRRPLRWMASWFNLKRQVRLVTFFLPSRFWYRAALTICRLQGASKGSLGGNRVLTEAVMLDHWLWELTAIGPFPFHISAKGLTSLRQPILKSERCTAGFMSRWWSFCCGHYSNWEILSP